MSDERAAELKGCPFCGEHAAEAGGVGCLNRKCEGSRLQLPRRTWNTRPIEDALRAKVSELTRLLGEAEERATILAQTILALMQKHSVYLKGKAVGMSDGEAFARTVSDAVQRAIQGAPR